MNGKRPFVMTNSMELSIFNRRRPLKSAAGAVAVASEGGSRKVRRVGIAHPVEESVGVEWYDVTFDFFSGVSIKVSGVDVGFVTRVIRLGGSTTVDTAS